MLNRDSDCGEGRGRWKLREERGVEKGGWGRDNVRCITNVANLTIIGNNSATRGRAVAAEGKYDLIYGRRGGGGGGGAEVHVF